MEEELLDELRTLVANLDGLDQRKRALRESEIARAIDSPSNYQISPEWQSEHNLQLTEEIELHRQTLDVVKATLAINPDYQSCHALAEQVSKRLLHLERTHYNETDGGNVFWRRICSLMPESVSPAETRWFSLMHTQDVGKEEMQKEYRKTRVVQALKISICFGLNDANLPFWSLS